MDGVLENIISNANSIQESDDTEVITDLAGFQVTKAELFSHTREPAVTIWENRIKFNMACLRKFPGVTHIQILIHPEQRRLIIRPCKDDAPDSLRWARGGGDKELANRDLLCKIFARKVFDLCLLSAESADTLICPRTGVNTSVFRWKTMKNPTR